MKFKDKKVVIAGGTSGIGLATANYFLGEGASVSVTGKNPGKVVAAREAGFNSMAVDSRDRKALDAFFTGLGPIDHLVIAVGGSKGMGNFAQLSLDTLREGFDEKTWPQLETLQAALPFIKETGSITLVTGSAATAKAPGISGLTAINGALELMVPALAREFAPIRINAVSPGVVDTPWWDFIPADNRPAAFAQFTAGIPVKRASDSGEIAEAILFLAGNQYTTGKILGVDGGMV